MWHIAMPGAGAIHSISGGPRLAPLHEGRQLFSGAQLQHRFAVGLLEFLQLALVLLLV